MTVAVVTPWHNHLELHPDYQRVIDDRKPDELWIIDNASDPALPFATVRFEANMGFAAACNHGLRKATTDMVVFLNNDVALTRPGWLERLVEAVEPCVLAGPLIVRSHAMVDDDPMPYLDGWCLAGMTDDLLELGGFNEELEEPAYYSDNLLCLEARAAGFTLRDVQTGLRHKRNQTANGDPRVRSATLHNHGLYMARARELLTCA